jgi:hypothetical protein
MRVGNRRSNRPWTQADDHRLRELARQEDQNLASIGAALGRTASSVASRVYNLGIRLASGRKKEDPLDTFMLNGEPLQFADTGPSCARCGVRDDKHREFGCGQFAEELRVRT